MRKVDVVRPPINYVVVHKDATRHGQVAWFVDEDDAQDFIRNMLGAEFYEIAEVRR